MLNKGIEPDFFEGETEEIIIDILQEYIEKHPDEKRRIDILQGVIDANAKYKNKAALRKKLLRNILKTYKVMTSSVETDLLKLGMQIMSGRKHLKVRYFGDTRYQVAVSKTSSDYRSGENLTKEMAKKMF